jgi:hypothetical protein
MNPALEGYEKGQESELGAVNVMTGVYTGRSPKDKFIVMDKNSKDTVWWTYGRVQERQPSRFGRDLGGGEEDRPERAVGQEALCGRRVLRREQGYPHGRALHHGSGLAGPFRREHVHPADGGGTC